MRIDIKVWPFVQVAYDLCQYLKILPRLRVKVTYRRPVPRIFGSIKHTLGAIEQSPYLCERVEVAKFGILGYQLREVRSQVVYPMPVHRRHTQAEPLRYFAL